MKKALALFLALIMALSLFACAETPAATSSSPVTEESPLVTTTPSTQPTAASPSASAAAASVGVGLHPDEVDHYARDPYKIVYIVCRWAAPNALLNDKFEEWGTIMNFQYESFNAQNDMDQWLTSLETYASQGYNGFILDFDNTVSDRVFEVCNEQKLNWITAVNPCQDSDGNMKWPGVSLDSYALGEMMLQWLNDNYSKYWNTIDTSSLGMVAITNSNMPDLLKRGKGATDMFGKLYPELAEKNCYTIDTAGIGITADVGYDMTAAVISAHPQIQHWFITSCMESLAEGAARATESMSKQDSTLITCIDASTLMSEWDSGYTGCWVSAFHTSPVYKSEPIICGLIAMIDGRATPETLWSDKIAEGQKYADFVMTPEVVTVDNYKECVAKADEYMASYIKK
jgi:ABC-type sugar transport system substrate-binding protein